MSQNLLSAVPVLGHHNGLSKIESISCFSKPTANVWCIKYNDCVCAFILIYDLNWSSDEKCLVQNLGTNPSCLPQELEAQLHVPLCSQLSSGKIILCAFHGQWHSWSRYFTCEHRLRRGGEQSCAEPPEPTLVSFSTPFTKWKLFSFCSLCFQDIWGKIILKWNWEILIILSQFNMK